jgi:DNA-binding transcriptional LysR family regulator
MTTKLKNFDNYRNFDWDLTKTFYFIAKLGSFVEASRVLGVIQPTLTRQIQALEKQLGFPLLVRHMAKGVTLTRKGAELIDRLEDVFQSMREFATDLDAITNRPKPRKIKITSTHAFIAYVLSGLLLHYTRLHPEITFELVADDHLMDIVLSDMDIGIQPLDLNRKGRKVKGVQADYLFSIEKKLYASTNYINTYGEPKSVEDLINHHVVSFPESESYVNNKDINWILTVGMPKGELRTPVYTSNSIESLIEAAEEGLGIVGSFEDYRIIKNSSLKNILPDVKESPLKSYFIYHDHLKEDEVIMDIKNYLMEKLNPLKI